MKIEEMSKELIEMARACRTAEERDAFIKAHHLELTAEQMEAVSGGVPYDEDWCDQGGAAHCHNFVFTGQTRPGKILGDLWPDYLHVCKNCGQKRWLGTKLEGFPSSGGAGGGW